MTWMPLPPPDRLLPRIEPSDVGHSRVPEAPAGRAHSGRGKKRGPGLWAIVVLFVVSLLLFLLAPRGG